MTQEEATKALEIGERCVTKCWSVAAASSASARWALPTPPGAVDVLPDGPAAGGLRRPWQWAR